MYFIGLGGFTGHLSGVPFAAERLVKAAISRSSTRYHR
jgi:hypothetical protein